MKIPLSKRLLACSNFVCHGDRVADIGCDHGYLGIYLLTNNIASSVIAADINQQPLDSALRNANKYGTAEKMKFYLSDGVKNIPRDFDTLVCAGMGADTIISILSAAPWLQDCRYRLVLQCQSKIHTLRKFLSETGWRITEESVLRDGRFLYTVMEVVWQRDYPKLTVGQWYFPPAILENPSKEVPEYYKGIVFRLSRAISGRGETEAGEMVAALAELKALAQKPELRWLEE